MRLRRAGCGTAAAQPPTRRRTSARPPVGSVFERRTVTTTSSPSLRSTSAQRRAATSPSGYRLDFAVLTTYTLDLEALLVLPLSVLAHPDGGLEELLADPLRLHQAIRDAGDRVHAFVDEKGIAVPRSARSLYSMLESSVHAVRAPSGGAFHPKVWVARFTVADAESAADDLLRVAILSRNLTFDRFWDVALASEASLRSQRRVAASRPLRDLLLELPRLATIPRDVADRVQALADQAWRAEFPAPEDFDSPVAFHALGLSPRRRSWRPPSSGFRTLAMAPFVNRTGLDVVSRLSGNDRTLVSRQEELDKLSEDALTAWKEVLVLSDTAQGEPEDGGADRDDEPGAGAGDRPSGLHAKMLAVEHGRDVTWYVGSANLTAAAYTGSNVEMMASVTGRKGSRGRRQRSRHRSLPRWRLPEAVRALPANRTGDGGPARDRRAGAPRSKSRIAVLRRSLAQGPRVAAPSKRSRGPSGGLPQGASVGRTGDRSRCRFTGATAPVVRLLGTGYTASGRASRRGHRLPRSAAVTFRRLRLLYQ